VTCPWKLSLGWKQQLIFSVCARLQARQEKETVRVLFFPQLPPIVCSVPRSRFRAPAAKPPSLSSAFPVCTCARPRRVRLPLSALPRRYCCCFCDSTRTPHDPFSKPPSTTTLGHCPTPHRPTVVWLLPRLPPLSQTPQSAAARRPPGIPGLVSVSAATSGLFLRLRQHRSDTSFSNQLLWRDVAVTAKFSCRGAQRITGCVLRGGRLYFLARLQRTTAAFPRFSS